MKKILIGTHNKGKFKEISYLLSKKYKKISPISLKIPSPKETSKTFRGNSKLKANFFSKFVNYPVISDDSGLCIKALKNMPGIYSARLAKKHGSFFKAMVFILNKMSDIWGPHLWHLLHTISFNTNEIYTIVEKKMLLSFYNNISNEKEKK